MWQIWKFLHCNILYSNIFAGDFPRKFVNSKIEFSGLVIWNTWCHEINSHEINCSQINSRCHEINCHEINLPQDQLS